MAGGLLTLIANSNSNTGNTYFIGNPKTYFFCTTYNQYCDFARQKFRMEPTTINNLNQSTPTNITFNIKRYGDLLSDTYLVLTLPDIFSPIFTDGKCGPNELHGYANSDISYSTYDFKWIKDIGTNIISEITIKIGGNTIQNYKGSYIKNIVERDYDVNKKDIFNKMIGNVPEMHSPELTTYALSNPNSFRIYPNTILKNSSPSIKSRQLYIPINSWFTLSNYLALPLVSLRYHEVTIDFTLRPLSELYVIRDLDNIAINDYKNTPYIPPSGANKHDLSAFVTNYETTVDNNTNYNKILPSFNIHLICTQIFLSEEQRCYFANNSHEYLFHDVKELIIYDLVGPNKIDIESHALVAGWMWFLQRSDIGNRNEWSNYSNLLYENVNINEKLIVNNLNPTAFKYTLIPPNYINDTSNIYIRPIYNINNEVNILTGMAIKCDGVLRENFFPADTYNYLDLYNTCNGSHRQGLYFYSCSLNNNLSKIQPYGFFNTNFFKKTEFDLETLTPNIEPLNNNIITTCDDDGNIISVTKNNKSLFEYTYTLTIQEDRYNILKIHSGMATLTLSR
tara:strand:+ start:2786 stop:4480 length:1695 start_codon:yes stop_codon:yes gene_type:complete